MISLLGSSRHYIGVSKNVSKRWLGHKYKAFHENANRPLYDALRKHGETKFRVDTLSTFSNEHDAYNEEEFLISYLRWLGCDLYNISLGGKGGSGMLGKKHTAQTKALQSASAAKRETQRHSSETKLKMSRTRKGRIYSASHRAKISAGRQRMWRERITAHVRFFLTKAF
jgi:group I intron endonuclease